MLNYLEEYKTIFFGGKVRQTIKHSENISPYSSYLWFSFDFCQIYKLNLLSDWFLVQCSKMSNLVDKYKTTFLGVWEKLLIIPKNIPILELPLSFSCTLNTGTKLKKVKFGQGILNHFFEISMQTMNLSDVFLPILELLTNLFWSVSTA